MCVQEPVCRGGATRWRTHLQSWCEMSKRFQSGESCSFRVHSSIPISEGLGVIEFQPKIRPEMLKCTDFYRLFIGSGRLNVRFCARCEHEWVLEEEEQ